MRLGKGAMHHVFRALRSVSAPNRGAFSRRLRASLCTFLDHRYSNTAALSLGLCHSQIGRRPIWWSEVRSNNFATNTSGNDGSEDVSSLLTEEDFHELADDVLHDLQERIEVYGEDLRVEGFDIDYASGVLTVCLGSLGTYVINKQTPNRQIWLSSPVSGPGRFDWTKSKSSWIYRRTNANLVSLLEKEFSELLGSSIRLS